MLDGALFGEVHAAIAGEPLRVFDVQQVFVVLMEGLMKEEKSPKEKKEGIKKDEEIERGRRSSQTS